MKNKILPQFLLLAVLFAGIYIGLGSLDLVNAFRVKHWTQTTEQKLGDMLYKNITETQEEITHGAINRRVDKLKERICLANGIDPATIKVHIIVSDQVNAFALPDNHLVIYTGLIKECRSPEELCGVMGHELGHIEHKHVMKKLTKEISLSALITLTAGSGGSSTAAQLLKTLTGTAYDRTLESEADLVSVDYMMKAKIDPKPYAGFLDRFGRENEKGVPNAVYWIASHPESIERAKTLDSYIATKKYSVEPVLSKTEWEKLKEEI